VGGSGVAVARGEAGAALVVGDGVAVALPPQAVIRRIVTSSGRSCFF